MFFFQIKVRILKEKRRFSDILWERYLEFRYYYLDINVVYSLSYRVDRILAQICIASVYVNIKHVLKQICGN